MDPVFKVPPAFQRSKPAQRSVTDTDPSGVKLFTKKSGLFSKAMGVLTAQKASTSGGSEPGTSKPSAFGGFGGASSIFGSRIAKKEGESNEVKVGAFGGTSAGIGVLKSKTDDDEGNTNPASSSFGRPAFGGLLKAAQKFDDNEYQKPFSGFGAIPTGLVFGGRAAREVNMKSKIAATSKKTADGKFKLVRKEPDTKDSSAAKPKSQNIKWTRQQPESTLRPEFPYPHSAQETKSRLSFPSSNVLSKPKSSLATKLTKEQETILKALFELQGKHCPDAYDKYQLLEERDRLLYRWRSEVEKTNVRAKKRPVGECPTMCTEKERYTRIVQNRISPFECDYNGSIVPECLVKEYARSAADQEKPLPHELRSPNVLLDTMIYLLTDILDNIPEDDRGGWYNFLWSRTRAIRKEITQLQLTDKSAVALVESCTRLHIVCSYLLCDLEIEKFDQNMNTENLGKCLQTLRHLYDDLAANGVYCDSEAEFRAYDVLLHLQDSNVLSQVLSYRQEVREAAEVKLSINLASAMRSKNYVRFFRILKKEASFLQCCVVHRFINQVRIDAVKIIVSASRRDDMYPIQTLINILAFGSRDYALDFLGTFGLHLNDMDRDHIVILKDIRQDVVLSLKTEQWIDAKRTGTLSETIHGSSPVPERKHAEVIDSFDEEDCYANDPVLAKLKTKYGKLVASSSQAAGKTISFSSEIASPPDFAFAPIRTPRKSEIDVEADSYEQKIKMQIITPLIESTLEKAQQVVMRKAVQDQVAHDKKEAARREAARLERQNEMLEDYKTTLFEDISNQLIHDCVSSVLGTQVKRIVCQVHREEYALFVKKCRKDAFNIIWSKILLSTLNHETRSVIKKVWKLNAKEIEEGLAKFRRRMSLLWLRQFWNVWRERTLGAREARLKRKADYDRFEPVWDSRAFDPLVYASQSKIERKTRKSDLSTNIDTNMEITNFICRRRERIARDYISRWQLIVSERKRRRQLEKMALYAAKSLQQSAASSRRPFREDSTNRRRSLPVEETPLRKIARLTEEYDESGMSMNHMLLGEHNNVTSFWTNNLSVNATLTETNGYKFDTGELSFAAPDEARNFLLSSEVHSVMEGRAAAMSAGISAAAKTEQELQQIRTDREIREKKTQDLARSIELQRQRVAALTAKAQQQRKDLSL